ncbi:MAG: branched-chain amino acid ABC transporter permease [Devosia sp.]
MRASELALVAVGLTMVYSVLRFPNFAHVEYATVGAYFAFTLSAALNLPLGLAAPVAVIGAALVGLATDWLVFRKLRERSDIILMIASFALAIAIREFVLMFWGPSPRFYPVGFSKPLRVFGALISPVQIGIIVTAVVCMGGFHLLLNRTRLGVSMRASADNKLLSEACGIPTDGVVRIIWLIGSGFAGLGGVLIALDTQLQPFMGEAIIIPVFGAAILGGIGSPYGAMLGALLFGFAENVGLTINWTPLLQTLGLEAGAITYIPAGYKEAIPFALLIAMLIFRPQGIMGRRRR